MKTGSLEMDNSSFLSIMSQIGNLKKYRSMFEITYETSTHFQWSCDFIFRDYDSAKKFLVNQGFNKVSNGFVSNLDTCPKAYITPKKIYV